MTSILHLPSKTLNSILKYKEVSVEDVINLSLTCKQLQLQIRNEEFWRYKFFQRWPSLRDICEIKWKDHKVNAKTEVLTRLNCRSKLLNYIDLLYERYYDKDDLTADDMKDFNVEFCKNEGAYFMNAYYFEDELLSIVNSIPENKYTDLKVMYYSMKLLMHMRNYHLNENWKKYRNQIRQRQILENAFTMFLQYSHFSNCMPEETVLRMVDILVFKVLKFIKGIFPNHSLFKIPATQLYVWICFNIENNYWSRLETMQILSSINTVICEEIKQAVHYQNNSALEVLKTIMLLFTRSGQALYFAAIFHVVARRLGVRCDIQYYSHGAHALIWKADYKSNSIKGNCYYIDVYDRHVRDNLFSTTHISISDLIAEDNTLTPSELMGSLSERILFSRPWGVSLKKQICKNIMGLIQRPRYYKPILEITHISKADDSSVLIHVRTKDVKYAIGMIMECTMSKSRTVAGVIYGWDVHMSKNIKVVTNAHSEAVFTNTLRRQNEKQPHYKILTASQESIYIPQDMVKPLLNVFIYHTEIGRYFCYFNKTHYVPNHKLEEQYPEDALIRCRWILTLALKQHPTKTRHETHI